MVLILILMWSLQDEPYYELYEKGIQALDRKEYDLAIQYLETAIAQEPESAKHKKTYGVQFEPYFPYHYLAQAFLFKRDFDKAREWVEVAYEYKENEDKAAAISLKFTENVIANYSDVTEQEDLDLSQLWTPIFEGDYRRAQNMLAELNLEHPGNPTLVGMSSLLKALMENQVALRNFREQLDDLEKEAQSNLDQLLGQARSHRNAGELERALPLYLAAQKLDPRNREATDAIQMLQREMEAQGHSQTEIQEAFEMAQKELEEREEQVQDITKKLETLQAENDQFVRDLRRFRNRQPPVPPVLDVDWDPTFDPMRAFTADMKVSVIGNVELATARLVVNGKLVRTWPLNGAKHFTSVVLTNHYFGRDRNNLTLEIVDKVGQILKDSYKLNFPIPPKPIGPIVRKVLVFLSLAVILLAFFLNIRKSRQAFRNRFNPYIAGAPILNDEMFFGRKPLLKQILNTLHNNSIMVYGERRIGKTSFLHQLHHILPEIDDPHYEFIPVFIDLQGVKENQFFSIMDQEIFHTLETRGIEAEPPSQDLDGRKFAQRVRLYINQLKKTCQKVPKLVLLLDEVDIMNGFSEQTNQQLRSVFMKGFARHLVAVMAGIHINTTWKSQGSPWYNFFEQLELKPFSLDQAKALITDPVKNVYQFNKDSVDLIIRLTQGKPYLIQKICVNLIAHILNENRRKITSKDVNFVFSQIKREVVTAE